MRPTIMVLIVLALIMAVFILPAVAHAQTDGTINAITSAAPFWGPLVAVLLGALVALYRRGNALQDKLMEFAMKSLEADKDTKAALDKVSDTSREMASAVNRLADKLMVRP